MAASKSITRSPAADQAVRRALKIIENEIRGCGVQLSSSSSVKQYLSLKIGSLEHEEFLIMWLDCQHRLIECEHMFRGTLTQTPVYPREVVKRALHHNAGAVFFAHNHPSGVAEPSRADEALTVVLRQALALVDVRVLDHFVIAGTKVVSMEEVEVANELLARAQIKDAIRARQSAAAKKAWRRRRAEARLASSVP